MSLEEFLREIEKFDGVNVDSRGGVSLDSLAALEIMAFLHRVDSERASKLDPSVDIYDFEKFIRELSRVEFLR